MASNKSTKKEKPHTERMSEAIAEWMGKLQEYPGWADWKHKQIGYVLNFDDPLLPDRIENEFNFSHQVEKEHAVVLQFLGLQEVVNSLKDCEFYFRRYPFRGLPMTRYAHLTHVCEMYFGRFYQLKERLKNYFDALAIVSPQHGLDVGKFMKLFAKEFDAELRTRNSIHHHRRFEDIAIERLFLAEALGGSSRIKEWRRGYLAAYQQVAREWARRVRKRSMTVEIFLDAVAEATLNSCPFLGDLSTSKTKRKSTSQ